MLFFHSSISAGDFNSGFIHPLTGLDHLMAMLSIGIISTLMKKYDIYWLPAFFVTSMLVGGILGYFQVPIYFTEQMIALSVIILGTCILIVRQFNMINIIYTITILFGIAYGYAHGIEMPFAAKPISYFMGSLSATILIHISGILIGYGSEKWSGGYIAKAAAFIFIVYGIKLGFSFI